MLMTFRGVLNEGAKPGLVLPHRLLRGEVRVLAHGGHLSEDHQQREGDRADGQRRPRRPRVHDRLDDEQRVTERQRCVRQCGEGLHHRARIEPRTRARRSRRGGHDDGRTAPVLLASPRHQAVGRHEGVIAPVHPGEAEELDETLIDEIGGQVDRDPAQEEGGAAHVRRAPKNGREETDRHRNVADRVRRVEHARAERGIHGENRRADDEVPHGQPAAEEDGCEIEGIFAELVRGSPRARKREQRGEQAGIRRDEENVDPRIARIRTAELRVGHRVGDQDGCKARADQDHGPTQRRIVPAARGGPPGDRDHHGVHRDERQRADLIEEGRAGVSDSQPRDVDRGVRSQDAGNDRPWVKRAALRRWRRSLIHTFEDAPARAAFRRGERLPGGAAPRRKTSPPSQPDTGSPRRAAQQGRTLHTATLPVTPSDAPEARADVSSAIVPWRVSRGAAYGRRTGCWSNGSARSDIRRAPNSVLAAPTITHET